MNKFSIEKIEIIPENKGIYIRIKASVVANIDMFCDEHRNLLQRLILTTEATNLDDIDAMRQAIENMLNHQYISKHEYYLSRCSCIAKINKIEYDFSNLDEPWRSLFEDLFKDANWSIARLINDAGSNAV